MIHGRSRWARLALPGAFHAAVLSAQLIAPGQPVPHTPNPPVVFLNGYQEDCSGSSFAATFGIADQVLQSNGQVSLFFDNCTVPGQPSIETVGSAFASYLAALKYDDGTTVDIVDVVSHSMGGLIVRSYLTGKQEQDGVFSPPATIRIRKAVFIASPNFGTGIAAFGFGLNDQLNELTSGSEFIFDLATWNTGTDDLRGIDAVAVAGNGGTGEATMPGFDDGVVPLTSASLGFYQPARTRVVPYCHVDGGGLITLAGLCAADAKGIALITSADHPTAQILVSFLNGTAEWQTVGQAAEQNNLLSTLGGLYVRTRTASGQPEQYNSATAAAMNLSKSNNQIAYTNALTAGQVTIDAATPSGNLTEIVTVPAGTDLPVTLKPGPNIVRVQPAAASVFPLTVAPSMIVSIFGDALAQSTIEAGSVPLPTMLSDAQVMLNGSALELFYVSPKQINAVLPSTAAGFMTLTVQNSSGASTVNIVVEAAHPAVFTQNSTGSGPAAAIDARNGMPVSIGNPLHAGDYLELFLTGLGADTQAQVTIGGASCPVTYAGPAPGFVGLDQINCQVPSGLAASAAANLVVTAGARSSNVTTVAVE
ncbi:MAG: hypothetical protein ABSE86_16995 [Bryobacteraceae bacterium]